MKNDYREIVVCSRADFNRLERFIEEICDYYNINNEYFGNILLATTEATDILLKIDEQGQSSRIVVCFDRNTKGLVFKIKAENGKQEVEEEDLLDRAMRKHKLARDIYIIKALADEITISVNARSIVLVFYVSSMNYEKALFRINQLKEYWQSSVKHIDKENG